MKKINAGPLAGLFLKLGCALCLALGLLPTAAKACTAVYVGSRVAANGATIIARSEDLSSYNAYNKMFMVVPAMSNRPGRSLYDSNGFRLALPANTYRYTVLSNGGSSALHPYPAVCTNEKGVSITATVDAYVKKEAVRADPYIPRGMREDTMAELIAGTAATARQGVEQLTRLISTKGVTEAYVVFIADQEETWMVEMYTGHQWAAVRLPQDKALVMGNQFMLDTLKDFEAKDILHSPRLYTLPEEKGFAVKEQGRLHLGKTYGGKFFTYNNGRTWVGQRLLAPKTTSKEYNPQTLYPFLFTPDQKVQVKQVMELYRNRFENTNLDLRLPQNKGVRAIGIPKQQEVHILELYRSMPAESSTLQWLCLANAEHSVFVPSLSGITTTPSAYRVPALSYNPASAYWQYQQVAARGNANRGTALGKSIREHYSTLEDKYIIDSSRAIKTAKRLYRKSEALGRDYVQRTSDRWAQEGLEQVRKLK